MKPHEGRKRRWGDRNDGFKVRNLDPMSVMEPYIMPKRLDSWVLFEDVLDITQAEEFIREKRQTDIPDLTLYEVVFAAIVRTLVEVPDLNRFCKHSKIYSRNYIKGAMVIMKGMSRESDRSMILPQFECEDTLYDVVRRVRDEAGEIRKDVKVEEDEDKTSFDLLESTLGKLPGFLLTFAINVLRFFDRYGLLPKKLTNLSPFHTSFFLTNMGSIGLDAVYHHIYEFGTLSIFGSIGRKEVHWKTLADGTQKRSVTLKMQFVVDERASDGFVYAIGFKKIRHYIMHPELLLNAPEKIEFDRIDKAKKPKKKKK